MALRDRYNAMDQWIDRMQLGSWLLIAVGLVLIGLPMLWPAYRQWQKVQAEHDQLEMHVEAMQQQVEAYRGYIWAVQRGEPLVLRRLAWHQLHLKPQTHQPVHGTWRLTELPGEPLPLTPIHKPLRVTVPQPPRIALDSQLDQLLLADVRVLVMALGVMLIGLGLLFARHQLGQSPSS